ncbi:MAG: hypothetical protein U0325_03225 [Polyangiales bacterium]
MASRRDSPWRHILTASGVLHVGVVAIAAVAAPRVTPPPFVLARLEPVDLTVLPPEAPPAPAPPAPAPPAPETPPPPAPAAATRALPRRERAEPGTVAPTGPTPTPSTPTAPPAPAPQGPALPQRPTVAPSLSAANILRASGDATIRGASEGWVVPPAAATTRGSRDIFGGARGPCDTPECLRAVAMAPVRDGLAATRRDDRPAGSGRADPAVARRAVEEMDLVRSVRGLGRAVAAAPMHTVPGQRRSVPGVEGGVSEEFDHRQGSSFSGMTYNASTSDLRYHLLRVELDVEQDAAGAVRSIQVSQASGFQSLDSVASRALREALGASDWRAPGARWTRWRLEVSDAVTNTPFANNDGWTVYSEPSDGTRVRVRMRVIAQRLIRAGDAGA